MTEETPTRTTATPTKSEEQNQTMKRELPRVTVSTSEEYVEKMSWAVAYAMLPNLSWRLLVFGNTSEESEEALEEKLLPAYHSIIKQFLTSGVEAGAFIAEAGDFAAYAAWFPPGSHEEPKRSSEASELEGKISIEGLGLEHDKVRDELIWSKHGQEYWYLGLLGRDPRKPAVSGAVRAVLQPSMDRAAVDGKPVWLTTSSPHARDIYLHLGWERVRTVEFGGFESWCMILYPPGTEEGPR
ncbi:hypothetical protein PV08_01989 [Exophiala spinifera]|uniref:N-acetyltransferase domain-containing protein n=1 Tax=Exophiala spinifera TaxID=91928 RepID=A0A0D2CD26_9EURO|nr:uncharacterized protein PV08_01989 [Exophiala spinifera]KIW21409.1 hypothetical protein PV08_01989 [Exophiala spinifera]